jgi:expansin (peptidoglycan-binding protein)
MRGLWLAGPGYAYALVSFRTQFLTGVQDMSPGLFEQIGDLSAGVLPISWSFMPVGWSAS